MELPFPEMDPYLEAPNIWPDVHNSLVFAIRSQIQPQISPRYTAVITPYSVFETIDIAPTRAIIPDIGVLERDSPSTPAKEAVTLAPAPMTGIVAMHIPTRYARIEIRTVVDEALVTTIEILSPANKRSGLEGAEAYERKRQEILRSEAHLLEIDLLRAGVRPSLITDLPDNPYFVFLSRVERRPTIEIWPLSLRRATTPLPVPLRYPDPDAVMNLAQAIQFVYTEARYDLRINYREAPPPPPLRDEDAIWLDAYLRERGLRD